MMGIVSSYRQSCITTTYYNNVRMESKQYCDYCHYWYTYSDTSITRKTNM